MAENPVASKAYSFAAIVEEAIGGLSEKDFRAKMSISYKEAREAQ